MEMLSFGPILKKLANVRKFFIYRLSKPINTNTMNCNNCRNDLIGFIRGTLPPGSEVRIREHLNGCPECRSFADYLRSTLDVIRIERQIAPDPFLATRIEGIMSDSAAVHGRFGLFARLIPALTFSTFILAGVAGGILVGKLIAPHTFDHQLAKNEITLLIDDLQQEPMETFIMGLTELADN